MNEIRESTSATLGLCAKYLGSNMNLFAIEFAPIFPTLMKDANENVRNNVAFCLAQMVVHGREAVYSYPFEYVDSGVEKASSLFSLKSFLYWFVDISAILPRPL